MTKPKTSKQAHLITLLQRPDGATLDELAKATGWKPTSVRGVLSGTLKKKLGLAIASTKGTYGTVYRIAKAGAAHG